MSPAVAHRRAAQRMRWERLPVAIRCGLCADRPAQIRTYVGLGRWLVQNGILDDRAAHERMLRLLLDTARDDALPWFWRSVCLEHAARPVARLTTLLRVQEPRSALAVIDHFQAVQLSLNGETQLPPLRENDA